MQAVAIRIGERGGQTGLLDRFISRRCREPGVTVGMQDDLVAREVLEPGLVVEVLDLGCNQDLQVVERKAAEFPDPALAGLDPVPEQRNGGADGRDDADAGHDDAARSTCLYH